MALTPQAEDFPRWYQDVVAQAEMAESGPARGSMVRVGPWPILARRRGTNNS